MTNKLKAIIAKAKPGDYGLYDEFLVIPTNKPYNGFFGPNGYNNLIILGRKLRSGEEFKRLCLDECDVLWLQTYSVNIDVPTDLECIRIWLDRPVCISDTSISTIIGR